MLLIADFSPIIPDFGIMFWTTLIFIFVWIVLGKVAFKPIAKALRDREHSITEALNEAERARKEMSKLKNENEKLLAEAREEKAAILKEAKEMKESIVNDAKTKAKDEASKIVNSAVAEIENQRKAAVEELKNQSGKMAVQIAEILVRKELKSNADHMELVSQLMKDSKLN